MKLTEKQTLLVAISFVAVAAGLLALQRYAFAAPSILFALIFTTRYLTVRKANKQARLIREAFAKLDVIQNDKRWLGAEASIVLWGAAFVEQNTKGRVTTRELLCRTNRGVWFVVAVSVFKASRITEFSITEAHDQAARKILQHDRALYTKYFALPETA